MTGASASRPRRPSFWQRHGPLFLLLALSWLLRIVLVLRGGQLYWPDERLYNRTLLVVSRALDMEWGRMLNAALGSPMYHVGFTATSGIPAAIQLLFSKLLGASQAETMWIAALFLSLASVACIGLVYAIVLRAGGGRGEAFLAALFMAAASTILIFARHLLPYDGALALLLLALWWGWADRPSLGRSFTTGILLSAGFLTYNGYWALTVVVAGIHLLAGFPGWLRSLRRGIAALAGALLLPLLISLVNLARGENLFTAHVERVVDNQVIAWWGTDNYWLQIWEYLWRAEHGVLLIWLAGGVAALWLLLRRGRSWRERGIMWLGGILALYLLLGLTGSGRFFLTFNAYGRHIRQLTPFLALAAAYGWWGLMAYLRVGARQATLGALLLLALAALNFARPVAQQWPADVIHRTVAEYGPLSRDTTVAGPALGPQFITDRMAEIPPPAEAPTRYVLLNVDFLYPVEGVKEPPAGQVLWRAPHPFQYEPFLYEGMGAEARAILRSTDISMRLIDRLETGD